MSEWQPAVYIGPCAGLVFEDKPANHGRKRIEIRPFEPHAEERRYFKCGATRFYEVRPEQCKDRDGDRTGTFVCQHEILTD
jgi:hypothetical protein